MATRRLVSEATHHACIRRPRRRALGALAAAGAALATTTAAPRAAHAQSADASAVADAAAPTTSTPTAIEPDAGAPAGPASATQPAAGDAGVAASTDPPAAQTATSGHSSGTGTGTGTNAGTGSGAPTAPVFDTTPPGLEELEAAVITTGITGRVVDATSGEAIIDAAVIVVGTRYRARTDVDGNFSIEVPPGTYTVRSYYSLYRPQRIEGVRVRRGATSRVEIRLQSTRNVTTPAQVVVVTARADTGTAATLMQVRRQSASVSDAISAEEISRSPDVTAGDSVRRVVGVSLVDGQYANVRGLGGRYVNVLLNGVPMPPTDPDVPSVQLDLLPAALMNSLTLVKSFTPDMPGDFAGGSLQLSSREFPARFTMQGYVQGGLDTLTHNGTGAIRYRGGMLDWLGFDDGTRRLPSAVPNSPLDPSAQGMSRESVADVARAFPNNWTVGRVPTAPNVGLGFTIGNTTRLAGRPLGYLFTLSYSNNLRRTVEYIRRDYRQTGGTPEAPVYGVGDDFRREFTQNQVLWGALGTLNYQPAPNHDLGLVAMFTQASTDFASFRTGYDENIGAPTNTRQLQYTARSVFFSQLTGDHRNLPLRARLRWQGFLSYGGRYEPDFRQATYIVGDNVSSLLADQEGVFRIYSSLSQVDGGGNANVTVPMGSAVNAMVGAYARVADRSFVLRRFSFTDSGADPLAQTRPPEEYFAAQNFGSVVDAREWTREDDSYRAIQQNFAGYARVDVNLPRGFRIVGGARYEMFRQWLRPQSPYTGRLVPMTETNQVDRVDHNVLPAASIVWAITPLMNLRAAYAGTVGRPLIREIAPYAYYDFVRDRQVNGNTALLGSFIHNADLRWEFFPGTSEVIAVSGFYKNFINPIELVRSSNNTVTVQNALGAFNFGAEFEARFGLRRLHRALAPFTVGANVALIYSRVQIDRSRPDTLNTTDNRPLYGQSPYLANILVGFAPERTGIQAYLYYNIFGERVDEVGINNAPDTYQDPLHTLDAVLIWEPVQHLNFRLTARNLLWQAATFRQAGELSRALAPAASYTLRATISY